MLHQSIMIKENWQPKRNTTFNFGFNIFLSKFFFSMRSPFPFFFLSFWSLGYFYLLRPNANFPSAVAWVGSSLDGRSVKQVKKNFAELAKKTHVSTFDSTFSSFSSFLFLLYWLLSLMLLFSFASKCKFSKCCRLGGE